MRTLLCVLMPVLSIALAGCAEMFGDADAHQPGTALGTFHVVGAQTSNACGAGALGATPTWEFDVVLARDDGVLFWNNGANIIQGSLEDDLVSFSIEGRVVTNMRAGDLPPGPPCSIERRDLARGTLRGAGDEVDGFEATLSYGFTPTAGSRCGDLVLGVEPGVESGVEVEPGSTAAVLFAALPCAIAYDLKATRRASDGG
jgi:hypothetical protein